GRHCTDPAGAIAPSAPGHRLTIRRPRRASRQPQKSLPFDAQGHHAGPQTLCADIHAPCPSGRPQPRALLRRAIGSSTCEPARPIRDGWALFLPAHMILVSNKPKKNRPTAHHPTHSRTRLLLFVGVNPELTVRPFSASASFLPPWRSHRRRRARVQQPPSRAFI